MTTKISLKDDSGEERTGDDELHASPPTACSLGSLSSEESEDEERAAWAERICEHLGPAPSEADIAEARREMWRNFPRELPEEDS